MSVKLPRKKPSTEQEWAMLILKVEQAINALSAEVKKIDDRLTKIGG